jgi:hypothetical protein
VTSFAALEGFGPRAPISAGGLAAQLEDHFIDVDIEQGGFEGGRFEEAFVASIQQRDALVLEDREAMILVRGLGCAGNLSGDIGEKRLDATAFLFACARGRFVVTAGKQAPDNQSKGATLE